MQRTVWFSECKSMIIKLVVITSSLLLLQQRVSEVMRYLDERTGNN